MAGPSIIARLGLDSEGLRRGLDNARPHIAAFGGAIAGAMSIGAVAAFASEMMDLAGNLQDMSDKTGVGVVALQELQFAFGQGGASAEDIDKAITKLAENTTTALGGNEKMIASFGRLGVSADDLVKLEPDEILMEIAKSAADAHDPAKRLSDILDVLGKSGGKMAPGLNAGAEAIRDLRKQALTLTADEVSMMDDASDKIANEIQQSKVALTKVYMWSEQKFQEMLAFADKLAGRKVPQAEAATADTSAADARAAAAKTAELEVAKKLSDENLVKAGAQAKSLAMAMLENEAIKRAIAGQKEESEVMQIRANFAQKITEAHKAGETQLAEQLQTQEKLTLQNREQVRLADEKEKKADAETKRMEEQRRLVKEGRDMEREAASIGEENKALAMELKGQKELAEEYRIKTGYAERIQAALEAGNTSAANELVQQRDITLEMQKQAKLKAVREKKIDDELAGPDARRAQMREQGRRERAGRSIDKAEAEAARTRARNEAVKPVDIFDKPDPRDRFKKRGGGENPAEPKADANGGKISEVVTELKTIKAAIQGLSFVTPPGKAGI